MPGIILIIWLPAAIMLMAVAWVLTLGAIGPRLPVASEEPAVRSTPFTQE